MPAVQPDEVQPEEVAELPLLVLADEPDSPVDTPEALADAVAALARGTGPVGVDAERASGYRYGQRAFLVQLRRAGAGTYLIDPLGCPDLSDVDAALADSEWVLHAASQDLPGLVELGMQPRTLFDTELAARLAGFERVGLAAVVERLLGYRLAKGHSSADWSQRPLTRPLLHYAALDVEVLVPLRDHLEQELREQGKWDWAQEEFAAIAAAPPPARRIDPWRRTSGLHRVRSPRQMAIVRSLWQHRDSVARRRDIAPGRILPDTAIVEAALRAPANAAALLEIPPFGGRATRRSIALWQGAIDEALALPESELPPVVGAGDGPPPTNRWSDRDPQAAARLAALRAAAIALAEQHRLPVENMIEPAIVRRLAWSPPDASPAAVAEVMATAGARSWQVELTSAALAEALRHAGAS